MGVGVAIAAIAVVATVATDIAVGVEAHKKQEELKRETSAAQAAVSSTNDFYEHVYKVIHTRLQGLQQSMKKLPPDVIDKLNSELKLDLSSSDMALQYASWALGGGQVISGIVSGVASYLIAGAEEASSILIEIGQVASAATAVLAVAGFGLALYVGITELEKLDDAIREVKKKHGEADQAMQKMRDALDGLLRSMHLQVGNYDQLTSISEDWLKLSENFDRYSTAFYTAITGFAMGKSQSDVHVFLVSRGSIDLQDDVLALAKVIQEGILDLIRQNKTDEQIINFFAKENPHEGLRFVLDSFFVDSLRTFVH